MELRSDLALRVYQQRFLGVDKPLGYTLDQDPEGRPIAVRIPDDVRWYVRHNDPDFDDSYIKTLVDEVVARRIPGLSLASCRRLTAAGFHALAGARHLRTLDLFNTDFSNEGVESLARLSDLESLNLGGTLITSPVLRSLTRLRELRFLHLGWTSITDEDLAALADLPKLDFLDLRNTPITNAGLAHVARYPALRSLGLEETRISDAGVGNLAPLSTRLERLYLGYTDVGDGAVESLKTFTKLRTLMLRATAVSRGHGEALLEALHGLGGVDSGPDRTQEGLIW